MSDNLWLSLLLIQKAPSSPPSLEQLCKSVPMSKEHKEMQWEGYNYPVKFRNTERISLIF